MISGYVAEEGRLCPVERPLAELGSLVWIDLVDPTGEEEAGLEKHLGIDIPTREEMEEIEVSSRLYTEDGASFMTAILPAKADEDDPEMAPVTFILNGARLITVRYHEPRAFQTFPKRAQKTPMGCEDGGGALLALLGVIVDRLADVLERVAQDIDAISREIFRRNGEHPAPARDFQAILASIGRKGDLTSKIRDSLVSLERLAGFLTHAMVQRKATAHERERLKTLSRDVRSLSDHASFLSQKITFLLDATLGMINIEQNATIKIFSVVAVVFLPPTLIASIYGMNFAYMPELEWTFGYPLALGLMVLCAILPYVYFKRRGWL